MKKTLLSILTGLMVIGLAVAAPTPDDRRALCEKHPEKYVWVEKDQFCAPISPCESDNAEIKKAYCLLFYTLPRRWVHTYRILDAYTERVLKTKLDGAWISFIRPGEGFVSLYDVQDGDETGYIGFKTEDGGYFSMPYGSADLENMDLIYRTHRAVGYAFAAYGYPNANGGFSLDQLMANVPNKEECDDIDSLAFLLGASADHRYESGKCILNWSKTKDQIAEFY